MSFVEKAHIERLVATSLMSDLPVMPLGEVAVCTDEEVLDLLNRCDMQWLASDLRDAEERASLPGHRGMMVCICVEGRLTPQADNCEHAIVELEIAGKARVGRLADGYRYLLMAAGHLTTRLAREAARHAADLTEIRVSAKRPAVSLVDTSWAQFDLGTLRVKASSTMTETRA